MKNRIFALITAFLAMYPVPVLAIAETGETYQSTVNIIHSNQKETESDSSPKQWKAKLSDYADDFSLISYETVTPDQVPELDMILEETSVSDILVAPSDSAVETTAPNTFAFTSYGWGHGVGMSQNGANAYAKYAGWNYQDILFHYYPGTVIKNTGTAETELVTVQGVEDNVLKQVSEIVNIEVGPSFHPECIKAQAVAVYTYIKYYNNDAHDLKGKPNPPQSLIDLCASVLGEALYFDDKFCLTMFCASCGGVTANCSDVFSADLPYLRSASSEFDSQYDPHWGDVVYYTVDEVRSRIEEEYHITLSDNPENWIQLDVGNGGYVNTVNIDGQTTARGNSFRSVMGLKSPKFTYICSIDETQIPNQSAEPEFEIPPIDEISENSENENILSDEIPE